MGGVWQHASPNQGEVETQAAEQKQAGQANSKGILHFTGSSLVLRALMSVGLTPEFIPADWWR